ncbi:MAG TPA: hypothetical protein VNF07_09015 [Acidimicrobiales bacterium]|nr:hypothetical protein [Acidimicrobiales bacterium]
MSGDPRSEERLAHDEAHYGRCPACGEVLAYSYEDEAAFCPCEASRHPALASMLAVQALPPGEQRRRFLVGATSIDGRTTTIELVLHGTDDADTADGRAPSAAAEQLARGLIAAGARRGTFHFPAGAAEAGSLGATLAEIKERGFAAYTSLPGA